MKWRRPSADRPDTTIEPKKPVCAGDRRLYARHALRGFGGVRRCARCGWVAS